MPFDTCALKKTQSIRTPGITPPLVAVFAGAGPWSIHKLAGDETCRMDQGPVGPGYRLSPGAPLNNCGWASILLVRRRAATGPGAKPQATSLTGLRI